MRPIDAYKLKTKLGNLYNKLRSDEEFMGNTKAYILAAVCSSISSRIDGCPTIEPERPKGKWEWQEEHYSNTDGVWDECGWKCSCCHRYLSIGYCDYDDHDGKPDADFCPMCGADMRKTD